MSKGSNRRPENSKVFEENFDKIFGCKAPQRGRYIQDRNTGKLVPAAEYVPPESDSPKWAAIHGDIEPFVSPVDGTLIDDRAKLREHNKRHGVTNVQDYGSDWFTRKQKERDDYVSGKSPKAKQERLETIQRTLHDHGIY